MKSYSMISTMNKLFEQLVQSQRDSEKNRPLFERNEGIYFRVEIRSRFLGYEKDGNTHHPEWEGNCTKWLHVIMTYPHSVFTVVTEDFSSDIPKKGWKNTSNHNSCWRSGCDELTGLVFECFDEAHKNMPKEMFVDREQDTELRLETSLCGNVFKFVKMDMKDREDNDYFKTISNIRQITKTITC